MQRCKNADGSDIGAHAEQTAWKESQQGAGSLQESLVLYLSFSLTSLLCTGDDNYTTCRSILRMWNKLFWGQNLLRSSCRPSDD